MKVAFWSEEDRCGTTSSMAAVASFCSGAWKMKTVLLQSRNQKGDLCRKLEPESYIRNADKGLPVCRKDGKNLYCLRDGAEEYRKQKHYSKFFKESMWRLIDRAEQFSDITFIDCGNGEDELSAEILSKADVSVVNMTQGRRNLDYFFQKRHAFLGNVIYLVNQYHQESVYNKQNLNRLYRIQKDELAVIPNDQFFRYASDNGKTDRFIRRHIHCKNIDRQFYFMQELMHTANIIVNTAGFVKKPEQVCAFTAHTVRK